MLRCHLSSAARRLSKCLVSRAWWEAETCLGRPYGKSTSMPSSNAVRRILPLPPIASLADFLITTRLRAWQEQCLPLPPGCFLGGAPGTQPLDIASAATQMVEKGLDNRSMLSLAQGDVSKFYDSVSPRRVAVFLQRLGADAGLILMMLLFQLTIGLCFIFKDVRAKLGPRSRGTLTGSRVAGAVGQIVIGDVMRHAGPLVRHLTLPMDVPLKFASWIDNVYACTDTETKACRIVDQFGLVLRDRWGLQLKPGSKQVMSVRGQALAEEPPEGWERHEDFVILGHIASHDGAIEADWQAACRSVWRRFWGGAGGRRGQGLHWRQRWSDVQRCCWPALAMRTGKWPWSDALGRRVDALQCRLLVFLQRERRHDGEDINAFIFRRARRAKASAIELGLWSYAVAKRVATWKQHCFRDTASRGSWAVAALEWRNAAWLQDRRRQSSSRSIFAGRTDTRVAGGGFVRPRWETTVDDAARYADRVDVQRQAIQRTRS